MFKGLSLDQAPPFEAPLLFFLSAPLFGIAGAILYLFGIGDFAILHSFTIGFLAFIMVGALQQMLPVVVGVKFEQPKRVSTALFALLTPGLLLFITALGFGWLKAGFVAAALLLLGLGGFSLLTLYKLIKAPRKSATVVAMMLSLLSLLCATLLGTHLLVTLALGKSVDLAFAHGALAGFGWVGLLIVGVSFQVIPMFYVTTELEPRFQNLIAPTLFAMILAYAMSGKSLFFYLIDALFLAYAIAMLAKLAKRKRAIKEPSIAFWQSGLGALILAALYGTVRLDQGFVYLFGYGFAMSIIYGMLYKIIPFLSWFHTSSRGFMDIPTMKEMLNERLAYLHLILHLAALAMLFTVPKVAALLIVAENILFYIIVKKPISIYFAYKKKPSPFEAFKMP